MKKILIKQADGSTRFGKIISVSQMPTLNARGRTTYVPDKVVYLDQDKIKEGVIEHETVMTEVEGESVAQPINTRHFWVQEA